MRQFTVLLIAVASARPFCSIDPIKHMFNTMFRTKQTPLTFKGVFTSCWLKKAERKILINSLRGMYDGTLVKKIVLELLEQNVAE